MPNRPNMEREQHWREVIRKQQSSNLSIAAFCRQHKIAPVTFFAWRRKLAASQRSRKTHQAADTTDSSAKFISLDLSSVTSQSQYKITLPNGCQIAVPTQFDMHSLRELLRLLQEQC